MKNPKKQASYFEKYNTKKIFQPTSFWSNLVKKNYYLIKKGNIKKFRNLNIGFVGFAPYFSEIKRFKIKNKTLNKLKKVIIDSKIKPKGQKKILFLINSALSGSDRAFNQYKILLTDKIKPFLYKFSESKVGDPTEQFNFDNNYFSASSLNYLNGLMFLKKFIKNFDKKIILEIGGGFGSVGEILNKTGIKKFKYINFDLPPLNIVSEYYLSKSCKQKIGNHFKFKNNKIIEIQKLPKLSCFPNFDIIKLKGKIDIFINFISFQEMEYDVVKNYLQIVEKLKPKYILLRNLREGKNTSKNTNFYRHKFKYFVKKFIKSNDYKNILRKNYSLLSSNVSPYGHKTWDNFNSELLLFKRR
jgi:putative sugar O-methyltransferase